MASETNMFGTMALTLFAGYNVILSLIVGILLILGDHTSLSQVWGVFGGILLILLGLLFSVGVYGLLSAGAWGRKLLSGCWVAVLPLYLMAIFPMLQNHQATTGNTLIQCASIIASLLALRFLWRPESETTARHPDTPSAEDTPVDAEEEMPAFTFDRSGKESSLFP